MSSRQLQTVAPQRKLGEILIDMQWVRPTKINEALLHQRLNRSTGLKLGQLLVFLNLISREQLTSALRKQRNELESSIQPSGSQRLTVPLHTTGSRSRPKSRKSKFAVMIQDHLNRSPVLNAIRRLLQQ